MVGTSPSRRDGLEKVTGQTQFIADVTFEGAWWGRALRCPHSRARVLSIDATAARAADPEAIALTAGDLTGPNVLVLIEEDWPVLADGIVNHATEPVALVAAPPARMSGRGGGGRSR